MAQVIEPSLPGRMPSRPLTDEDLRSPRQRRVMLPVVLFIVTCLSTFFAGASGWLPDIVIGRIWNSGNLMPLRMMIVRGWDNGLIYMTCVLAILLTHEMGHFIATIRYRIAASLPYFIPFPFTPFGTMGAVIGMDGLKANRKQLFDIGLAGPLAGLVVAVPVLWIGIMKLDLSVNGHGAMAFHCPLLARWLMAFLNPAGYAGQKEIWMSQINPYFMAGWVGLLITGLNMMPVSQLDGGHVIYTLFGRRAHWIARGFLLLAIVFIVFGEAHHWILMVMLVMFIGTDHPPTSNDRMLLGRFRSLLGWTSLAIPVLCFPPHVLTIVGR